MKEFSKMKRLIQKIMNLTLAALLVLTPVQAQARTLAKPVSISLDQVIVGEGYISDNGNAMIPLRLLSEKLN